MQCIYLSHVDRNRTKSGQKCGLISAFGTGERCCVNVEISIRCWILSSRNEFVFLIPTVNVRERSVCAHTHQWHLLSYMGHFLGHNTYPYHAENAMKMMPCLKLLKYADLTKFPDKKLIEKLLTSKHICLREWVHTAKGVNTKTGCISYFCAFNMFNIYPKT